MVTASAFKRLSAEQFAASKRETIYSMIEWGRSKVINFAMQVSRTDVILACIGADDIACIMMVKNFMQTKMTYPFGSLLK